MLRRLATFVLLVPLSLNGLWMICAEDETAAETVSASAAIDASDAEGAEHCAQMCPIHQPEPGAICLISSNGDGTSLAAIFFVVAPPPAAETLTAAFVVRESVPEPAAQYSNPSLAGSTPPPKA
jgi:hypothetical protein